MQKLGAAILLYLGLVVAAPAQQVVNPLPNAGIYGAYNASPPTCVTGTGCWVQTDINGNLKVAIAGDSGGTVTANQGTAGTNAQAWWTQIGDGTNGPVAVKPASTAAAQTDFAFVERNPDIGTVSDTVCATATGNCSLIALQKFNNSTNPILGAGTARVGYASDDPCSNLTKTNFTISTTSGTVQLVAPSGSTQVYLCSLFTIGATASIQNIVGGTGASCTTGTPVAMAGSTTTANGMSFAANGGFTFGNGAGTILRTTTAGHGVCLIQNATAQISGGGTFVQQ